jgi:drug/metabolite transporter (DMT)-like permease
MTIWCTWSYLQTHNEYATKPAESMQKNTILVNHALLQVVVFIWGLTGVIGKASPLSAEVLSSGRMLVAFATLFLIMLPRLKRSGSTYLTPNTLFKWSVGIPAVLGPVIALHWFTFFEAIKLSNVSTALSCFATVGIFTSLLEPFVLKTRINVKNLAFSIVSLVGVTIIYYDNFLLSKGVIYAVVSALLASVFTTCNALCVKKKARASTVTLFEMLSGYIFMIVLFDISTYSALGFPSYKGVISVVVLGVLCTAVPFVLSVYVMKHLPPSTVAISVNLEQVYSIVIAVFIWRESEVMTPTFYLGAFLICISSLLNAALHVKQAKS